MSDDPLGSTSQVGFVHDHTLDFDSWWSHRTWLQTHQLEWYSLLSLTWTRKTTHLCYSTSTLLLTANCPSVCLSAPLVIHAHTRFKIPKRLLHRIRYSDVSSFLRPNFIVVSLGDLNECVKERIPVESENLTNNRLHWKRCEIGCKLVLITMVHQIKNQIASEKANRWIL